MEWLVWLLVVPIAYVVIGAVVLATLDRDQEFYRLVRQQDSGELAVLLWPIAAYAILIRRRPEKTEKGF